MIDAIHYFICVLITNTTDPLWDQLMRTDQYVDRKYKEG